MVTTVWREGPTEREEDESLSAAQFCGWAVGDKSSLEGGLNISTFCLIFSSFHRL
jgi:hypothetical protein